MNPEIYQRCARTSLLFCVIYFLYFSLSYVFKLCFCCFSDGESKEEESNFEAEDDDDEWEEDDDNEEGKLFKWNLMLSAKFNLHLWRVFIAEFCEFFSFPIAEEKVGKTKTSVKKATDRDDLFSRIEESRMALEDELGMDLFIRVYRYVQVSAEEDLRFVTSFL